MRSGALSCGCRALLPCFPLQLLVHLEHELRVGCDLKFGSVGRARQAAGGAVAFRARQLARCDRARETARQLLSTRKHELELGADVHTVAVRINAQR